VNEGVPVGDGPRRGGAVDSRVLRFGLGPKVAPAARGVKLERESERAKGDGGGIEESLVIYRCLRKASYGSTDMDVRDMMEVPREGGSGRSVGSTAAEGGSRDMVLAGGMPLATSQGGIGGVFGTKIDGGGSSAVHVWVLAGCQRVL
jgi:hypothetical protein